MKLFITGASGLLGCNLSFAAAQAGHSVLAAYNEHAVSIRGCSTIHIDLLNPDFLKIRDFGPDCIVHCAALTNVDICEQNHELAHALNVEATERLARYANSSHTRLIFISTDSVFDGKNPFHNEEETPHALNYYAQTKIDAEKTVRTHENHAIVRTNFYGFNIRGKQSFSEWLHAKFMNRESIPAFTDFFFSPIIVNNLAEVLVELAGNRFTGTLHVAGNGRISKYEFALRFADIFHFDSSLVMPTKMNDLGVLQANRPNDCSLDISRSRNILKTNLPDIPSGISLYKQLFEQGYQNKLRGV